jgi:hypothetical protein
MIEKILSDKRDIILESWLHHILDSYPIDGARFFGSEKDRFNNPVGYTFSQEIKIIYAELLDGFRSDILQSSLDKIIRIRTVQDFSPSQAISFVYLLKKVLREELESEIADTNILRELMVFEARIDQLALLAFDIYALCRNRIYEIRVNEIKKRSISFLKESRQEPDSNE